MNVKITSATVSPIQFGAIGTLQPGSSLIFSTNTASMADMLAVLLAAAQGLLTIPQELAELPVFKTILPWRVNGDEPESPAEGDAIWSTTDVSVRVYNGAHWVSVGQERWIKTDSMINPRAWYTVVALSDGRALHIAGWKGTGANTVHTAVEFFNPATKSYTPADPIPGGLRWDHGAIAYKAFGGVERVIVWGGCSGFPISSANSYANSYIFKPEAALGSQWAGPFALPTEAGGLRPQYHIGEPHMAVLIDGGTHDGKPLVIGGYGPDDAAPSNGRLNVGGMKRGMRFDPDTDDANSGAWVKIAEMADQRGGAAFAAIGEGKVVVAGGISQPAGLYLGGYGAYAGRTGVHFLLPDNWTDKAEVYDADTDTWAATDSLPVIAGETTGPENFPIAAPAGKPAGYAARRVVYNSSVALKLSTSGATKKMLVVGGNGPVPSGTLKSRPRSSCLIYDHAQAPGSRWTVVASTKVGHLWGHYSVMKDSVNLDKVLAAGGLDEYWSTSGVTEVYDIGSNTWRTSVNMPPPSGSQDTKLRKGAVMNGAFQYFGVRLADNTHLMAGGTLGQTFRAAFLAFGSASKDSILFIPGTIGPGSIIGTRTMTPALTSEMATIINNGDYGFFV